MIAVRTGLAHTFGSQRCTVAAALSAAVTTTKPLSEIDRTRMGAQRQKEKTSLFPATLRERGSGGEALLFEKRPLPEGVPTVDFSSEGGPGEGLLFREALPRGACPPLLPFLKAYPEEEAADG